MSVTIDDGLGPFVIAELAPHSWWLVNDYAYTTDQGCTVRIDAGFLTDGASAPFHIAIKAWNEEGGKYGTAALVHDFLCTKVRAGAPDPCAQTRAQADAIFFEIMRKTHVDFFVRWAMWAAVRVAGIWSEL